MSKEIEKRWILQNNGVDIDKIVDIKSINVLKRFKSGYCNTYFKIINSDAFTRFRIDCSKDNVNYKICTKIGHGLNRTEIENQINESDFRSLIHGITPIYFDYIEFETKNNLKIEIKYVPEMPHIFIFEVEYPSSSWSEDENDGNIKHLLDWLTKVYHIKFNDKLDFNNFKDVTEDKSYELVEIFKNKNNIASGKWIYPKFDDKSTLPDPNKFVLCHCVDLHNNVFYAYLKFPIVDGHQGFYGIDQNEKCIVDDGCDCIEWFDETRS